MPWEPLPDEVDHTHSLDEALGMLHRRLGLARPDVLRTLERHWVSLVGSQLASHCRVESVRHERLVVVVDDPAIAEHLRWSSSDLLAAVGAVCDASFTELVVKVAR
ncbi:MAG: DUF721 domain-containing protein [Microthrixaceae bacterium]